MILNMEHGEDQACKLVHELLVTTQCSLKSHNSLSYKNEMIVFV